MEKVNKLDYVILGLLCHEDLTGYDIKKRIDGSLSYFFGASFGSIYPALNSLLKNGYVSSQNTSENHRNRISYSITQSGRTVLQEWLKSDIEKNELRYETLLKLFFGNEAGFKASYELIDRFENQVRTQLKSLRFFASTLSSHLDDDTHKYYYLTVKFGIRSYESYLIWCQEAKDLLESWDIQ